MSLNNAFEQDTESKVSLANAEHVSPVASSLTPPPYSVDGNTQPKNEEELISNMESQFQVDLGNIEIVESSEKAKKLGVKAFTESNTIHFAPGEYKPNSGDGQEMIIHELIHVIQADSNKLKGNAEVNGMQVDTNPAKEAEANTQADKLQNGEQVSSAYQNQSPNSSTPKVGAAWGGFGDMFSSAVNSVKSSVSSAVSSVVNVASSTAQSVSNTVSGAIQTGREIFSDIRNGVGQAVQSVASGIGSTARRVRRTAGRVVRSVGNTARQVVNSVRSNAAQLWETGKTQVQEISRGLSSGMRSLVSSGSNWIRQKVEAGMDVASAVGAYTLDKVKSAGSGVWNSIQNFVQNPRQSLGNLIEGIATSGSNVWSWISDKGQALYDKARDIYSRYGRPIIDNTVEIAGGIWDTLKNTGGEVLGGLKRLFQGDTGGFADIGMGLAGGIASGIDIILNGTAGYADAILGPQGEAVTAADLPEETAAHEFFAHRMAYVDPDTVENGTIQMADRKIIEGQGYSADNVQVRVGSNGLVVMLFMPDPTSANPAERPMLAFRGTDDIPGVITDMDPIQVGHNQYYNNLDDINELSEMAGGSVDVTGHSLGGAMAQIFAANHTSQIHAVTTFQSPGVSESTVEMFNENLGEIDESDQPIINHHTVESDLVSRAGEQNLPGNFYEHDLNVDNPIEAHKAVVTASAAFADQRAELGMSDEYVENVLEKDLIEDSSITRYDEMPMPYQRAMAEFVRSGVGTIRDLGIDIYETGSNLVDMYHDYQNQNTVVDPQRPGEGATDREQDRFGFESYPEVEESSGWLFGQEGVQATEAESLFELGMASLANLDVVYLTGEIQEQMKADPGFQTAEQEILAQIRSDSRFGNEAFYATDRRLVGFGGDRWRSDTESWDSLDASNPLLHGETWDVAANQLTWALRNATLRYWAEVDAEGNISITYHVNDTLDLSPSEGRSEAYNAISSVTGLAYHTILGGNKNLQTRSEWTTSY